MQRKHFLPLVFAALPFAAPAGGGAWDGIYSCVISAPGLSTQSYITVNGQTDGQAIFAVAAARAAEPFYGYGIGRIDGTTFSGNTMFERPFSMSGSSSGFTGTIGIVAGNATVTASANCTRIW
ncbi:MAG: hypothetical protein HYS20_15775 [Rhodocyclales bacterium]|nr:hypothetical protein [Rhodocyclales bacterium]